jgi:hypothetical protein
MPPGPGSPRHGAWSTCQIALLRLMISPSGLTPETSN